MWSPLLLCLFLAAAAKADYCSGWKEQTSYKYQLQGRTLSSLHQVANQYAGLLLKANLHVVPKMKDHLIVEVRQPEYAEIHANLSNGWKTHIPESKLNYKQLPINSNKFELKLKNGVIRNMTVNQDTPTWELNMLKAIASLMQVDTTGVNLKKSSMNQLPEKDDVTGVYKTMEDSVTGECETLYDISDLPSQVLQMKPQLAPLPKAGNQLIDIVKTRNFSNCDNRPVYHFGITGSSKWDPASSSMGDFISVASQSRIILSGRLNSYTVQSSDTADVLTISPLLYNPQKGMVASHMNISLVSIEPSQSSPSPVLNPQTIHNLVYEYDSQNRNSSDSDSSESDSSSSSSSSSSGSSSSSSTSSSSSSSNSLEASEDISDSVVTPYSHRNNEESRWNAKSRIRRSLQLNIPNYSSSSSESNSTDSSSSSDSSYGSSSSSSESNSSEEERLPKPKLSQAPKIPFLPIFSGIGGQSIESLNEINTVSVVRKIALQIADDLENPTAIPGQNTPTKFSVLVQVIRAMNADKLQQLNKELYYQPSKASSSSSNSARNYRTWVTYRDAVAEAGTGPALLAIKDMIESGKVNGEEAAQLLAVLSNSAQFPTAEYLSTLFELTTSQRVTQQRFLNVSAIHSFSDILRKAHVDSASVRSNYPVYTFGRPLPKKLQEITNRYIPHLQRELNQAIEDGDSPRVQAYTVALGRTAHPNVLNVFEPYLEGKKIVSEYQRLVMVAALNDLVKVHPNTVRPVLFRIYQNVGESPKLRIVAAYLIMKTNPPAEILQRMAQFTNEDINEQVNSAVQSIIKSAANLQNPDKKELRQNAQAAVGLLTDKDYGKHYSKKALKSFLVQELSLSYDQAAGYIGSEDTLIPNSIYYSLKRNLGGYNRESLGFAFISSSVDDLLDVFEDQVTDSSSSWNKNSAGSSQAKYSAQNLANILNIEHNERAQVEASLLVSALGGRRFFAIDNNTIEQLPQIARIATNALSNGQSLNYTKIYNQYSIVLGFPTAMGLPAVYDLNNPTIVSIGGEVKAKFNPNPVTGNKDQIQIPATICGSAALHVVYSTQAQAKLGFVTPFSHMHYIAGVDKNIQINVPVHIRLDLDMDNKKAQIKVQPLESHNEQNLFEFSATPYTSKYNIKDLLNEPRGENYEEINVRQPNKIQKTVGQDSTGFAFQFNYESQQQAIGLQEIIAEARKHDLISAANFLWAEESINNFNMTVKYVPQKTTASYATFTVAYAESRESSGQHDNSQATEDTPTASMAEPSSSSPDSHNRQKEFLRKVSTGIQNSTAAVVDVSAAFRGKTDTEYVATVAVASSYVSPLSRMLLFVGKSPAQNNANSKPFQACLSASASMPNVPEMNYERALNTNPTSYVNAQLRFGEKCSSSSAAQVTLRKKLKQSSERQHYVEQLPLTQQCKQEMKDGNYVQYACRNAIIEANLFDQYNVQVTYDKVPDYIYPITYKAYSVARYLANPHVSEDVISPNNPNNKLEMNVNFAPDLHTVNVSIDTPMLSAKFSQIRLNKYIGRAIVEHPQYSKLERVAQQVFQGQLYPTCAIDSNNANTFDNKSYPIQLGKCWYVIMASTPKQNYDQGSSSSHNANIDDERDVAVLVRGSAKKEVMIVLSGNTIHLRPGSSSDASIQVNNKQLESPSKKNIAQYRDSTGETIIEYYSTPTGSIKLKAPKHKIELIYSPKSVKLVASNVYRKEIRGLCGTFDSEPSNDFTAPSNYIVENPYDFAASYAVADENCDSSVRSQQGHAKHAAFARDDVIYGNVISNKQDNRNPKHTNQYACMTKRVQYIRERNSGKICFTTKPHIACRQTCREVGTTNKEVTVHCIQENDAAQHWMSAVDKGENPNFSQKQPQQTKTIQVPQSCAP